MTSNTFHYHGRIPEDHNHLAASPTDALTGSNCMACRACSEPVHAPSNFSRFLVLQPPPKLSSLKFLSESQHWQILSGPVLLFSLSSYERVCSASIWSTLCVVGFLHLVLSWCPSVRANGSSTPPWDMSAAKLLLHTRRHNTATHTSR